MRTLTVSEARADLKSVIDNVVADKVPALITRKKGEGVVIIARSEWDAIEETLYRS